MQYNIKNLSKKFCKSTKQIELFKHIPVDPILTVTLSGTQLNSAQPPTGRQFQRRDAENLSLISL